MAGDAARATVERAFTWERCGAATVAAYEEALARARAGARRSRSCFVTNHVPPDRVGAFAALHARVADRARALRRALAPRDRGRRRPRRAAPLRRRSARSTRSPRRARYRAVVCGTAGRVALPAAWLGARARRASRSSCGPRCGRTRARPRTSPAARRCWPRCTATPTPSSPTARTSPRSRARAARATSTSRRRPSTTRSGARRSDADRRGVASPRVFLGRPSRAKGAQVLLDAWRASGFGAPPPRSSSSARDPGPLGSPPAARWPSSARSRPSRSATSWPPRTSCVVPSLRTRSFREPWGLVANEAMNQPLPSSPPTRSAPSPAASCATSATASSCPPATPRALAAALRRLHDDAAAARARSAPTRAATSPRTPSTRGPPASHAALRSLR